MSNNIDNWDYLLIGVGIILLPVFLIGLLPIGMAIWRIGGKIQNHKDETDRKMEEFDRQTKWEIEEIERKYRKEDPSYLDPEKVENWT